MALAMLWLHRLACDHERIRAFAEDCFRWISTAHDQRACLTRLLRVPWKTVLLLQVFETDTPGQLGGLGD